MAQEFKSEALEANKYITRQDCEVIPQEQEEFLEISASYWGINNSAREFIKEYNHPYSNWKFLSEHIKKIAIDNIWLYKKSDKRIFAVDMIIDFFKKIFEKAKSNEIKQNVMLTYLQFFDLLAGDGGASVYVRQLSKILDGIEKWIVDPELTQIFVEISGNFKTQLDISSGKNESPELAELSDRITGLIKQDLQLNLRFWQEQSDVLAWLSSEKHLLTRDYSADLVSVSKDRFAALLTQLNSLTTRKEIVRQIPSFKEIANSFRSATSVFDTASEKIYYLFYLLYLNGMNHLKDHLLWDINKLMKNISNQMDATQIEQFLKTSFGIFKVLMPEHEGTILDCIATLGKAMTDSGNENLINMLQNEIINLGFISPGEIYLTEDWQIHRNINHVKNIRVWMELTETAPEKYSRLLQALIVNLKIGGIFISDTDLFQKDVSKLLNSPIEPVYKQVKQLCRAFPVYFNEIGAEGELREVSTLMDEIGMRKDNLIHFMRKQVHTESNNTHIDLAKKILCFWYDGKKERLHNRIPEDVYESIDLSNVWFVGMHEVIVFLCDKLGVQPENLVSVKEQTISDTLDTFNSPDDLNTRRLKLFIRLQILLKEKYSFSTKNIISILHRYSFFNSAEIDELSEYLDDAKHDEAIKMTFDFMEQLNQVVFNPEKTESWENIYYKRHVAVGIPSMYGEYHEKKFEALGLIFRLEKLSAKLIEKEIMKINFSYLNANSLHKIFKILTYFNRGIRLDGIKNEVFNSNLQMLQYALTSKSFSLGQYINILQFIHKNIQEIINK